MKRAAECFREAAEVFYDRPSSDDILTFFIRWE